MPRRHSPTILMFNERILYHPAYPGAYFLGRIAFLFTNTPFFFFRLPTHAAILLPHFNISSFGPREREPAALPFQDQKTRHASFTHT